MVTVTEFHRHCLTLLDDLGTDGIVITRQGRPVARLLPMPQPAADLIGAMRGRIRIRDEILSTGVAWNAGS